MANYIKTVTQPGVTKSQPGINFGGITDYTNQRYVLSLFRYYPDKKNAYGGKGSFQYLADHGKIFATSEEATKYGLDHGYIMEYRRNK